MSVKYTAAVAINFTLKLKIKLMKKSRNTKKLVILFFTATLVHSYQLSADALGSKKQATC